MLTDQIISARPFVPGTLTKHGKPLQYFKLPDTHQLELWVYPTRKVWHVALKAGKDCTLGAYPELSIETARLAAAERRSKAQPIPPAPVPPPLPAAQPLTVPAAVAQAVAPASVACPLTFAQVAEQWLARASTKQKPWSADTLYKKRLLFTDYLAALHHMPVESITRADVRQAIKARESEADMAERARGVAVNVIDYARDHHDARVLENPARHGADWIAKPKPKHHAAIIDQDQLGLLVEQIDLWDSRLGRTCSNMTRLQARTLQRSDIIRQARWEEFKDLDKPGSARWELSAERMKMKEVHIVPLAAQSVAILAEQKALAGGSPWVFPGRTDGQPMAENALTDFLGEQLDYKGRHTPHGWRTSFSVLVDEARDTDPEMAWVDDRLIELVLDHKDRKATRAAYKGVNRPYERMPARRKLAQWWADRLDYVATHYKVDRAA